MCSLFSEWLLEKAGRLIEWLLGNKLLLNFPLEKKPVLSE